MAQMTVSGTVKDSDAIALCPVCPAYAAYATCADRFEDAYLNEMGRQGWEMVSLSRLEETVPGGQWCRAITVGYGFEVAWKWVK